ncbi:MAG: hypothetical protein JRJ41_07785 [Deltaproteobacteria bacterium]|jgi:hypothetical protein|nr:hypothetical protein [Deltaproteobacteria bacterium]
MADGQGEAALGESRIQGLALSQYWETGRMGNGKTHDVVSEDNLEMAILQTIFKTKI